MLRKLRVRWGFAVVLALMVGVAVYCQRAERQRKFVNLLRDSNCRVVYANDRSFSESVWRLSGEKFPSWKQPEFWDDYRSYVHSVSIPQRYFLGFEEVNSEAPINSLPLEKLTLFNQLRSLHVFHTSSSSLKALSGMGDLELLHIASAPIHSIQPISNLKRLRHLAINAPLKSLKGAEQLDNLESLILGPLAKVDVEEFQFLADLDKLNCLEIPASYTESEREQIQKFVGHRVYINFETQDLSQGFVFSRSASVRELAR